MIEIKRDSYLALFYIAALAAAVYLVATGKATFREVSAFFAGSSFVPALVQKKPRARSSARTVNSEQLTVGAPILVTVEGVSAPPTPTPAGEVSKDGETERRKDGKTDP